MAGWRGAGRLDDDDWWQGECGLRMRDGSRRSGKRRADIFGGSGSENQVMLHC